MTGFGKIPGPRTLIASARAILALCAFLGCSGSQARVVAFDVKPRSVCPGDTVVVTWEVVGPAKLAVLESSATVEPKPDELLAQEQAVASKDRRLVPIQKATWLAIRAVEADPAKGSSQSKRAVDIPATDEPVAVTTTCEGIACRGVFELDVDVQHRGRVVAIFEPKLRQDGKQRDARICVTHASLQGECIEPGHRLETNLPAGGKWTLETNLPVDAPSTPPGLSVKVHIICP